MNLERATPFGLLTIGGILLSAWVWSRLTRKKADPRLTWIYFGALLGAVIGAKVAFLVAEGWHYRSDVVALLTGRSVTGALIGGYAGVELTKARLGYRAATGDLFAIIVPLGLIIGRVGCMLHGCCLGVACPQTWWTVADASGTTRWPAAWVEAAFNLGFVAWALWATRRGLSKGNCFHAYLIAYGVFRFGHEFLRADAVWYGGFTGYHAWAIGLVVLGSVRMRQRLNRRESSYGEMP